MLTNRPAARQAHLRSHSGRSAGVVFSHAPTTAEYIVPPHLFRVLLLERLQLPLPLTEATCNGCHEPLDPLGRHRAACTRSGRIKKRSSPTERMLAIVCREAGARVKFNAYLRDINLGICGADERHIEVLAQDLPCFNGAQLAVDITMRSALGASGEPQPRAAEEDGAVPVQARRDKEATNPELLTSGRCRLVVVGIETGGRWSDEAADFLWQLAVAKAREAPALLAQSAALAWERRWTRMLGTACAVAFAESLVELSERDTWCQTGGAAPSLAELLTHDPR